MEKYVLDTNIWIEIHRGNIACASLKEVAARTGGIFCWAPPVLIELFNGVIAGGAPNFSRNQTLFARAGQLRSQILDLPAPFIWRILWKMTDGKSRVLPSHYQSLIEMLVRSNEFSDFLKKTRTSGSVWQDIDKQDRVHQIVLDQELGALRQVSFRKIGNRLSEYFSRQYSRSGLRPDPTYFEHRFSAALEFLVTSMVKVRHGAKPEKNDPGQYTDLQLFFYLGDPEIVIVTNEDFSQEIRESPQKSRIISFQEFKRK
jgi:hypothetical protein